MNPHLILTSFAYHPHAQFHLSHRQVLIIILALCGYTPQEAAGKMNLTLETVYTYRRRIMKRLGFETFEGVLGWIMHERVLTVEKAQEDEKK